jgi:hypothetical protein
MDIWYAPPLSIYISGYSFSIVSLVFNNTTETIDPRLKSIPVDGGILICTTLREASEYKK